MAGTRACSPAKESKGELDWKASQCGQEDLFGRRLDAKETSILDGRMLVNVKHAIWRKANKNGSDCTTVQNGTKSGLQKVGAKGENVEKRVEVSKRYCNASSQ